jgi:hypothetical protein
MFRSHMLIMFLASATLAVVAGCSADVNESAGTAPPPPPATEPGQVRTYDYSHKVLNGARRRSGKRWVVAVLRFGDTKDVEGQPYGAASQPATPAGGQVNVNVKVVGTENPPDQAGTAPRMPKQYREMLKQSLIKSEAYTVVERERVLEILREINFGKTKFADPLTAPKEGALMCVRYLIEGNLGVNEDKTLKDTIEKDRTYRDAADAQPGLWDNIFSRGKVNREKMLGALRRVDAERTKDKARREFHHACYLSAYDVRTGAVATTVMGLGSNFLEAIDDAVEEMTEELSTVDQGIYVAAVAGEKIYLDAGSDSGMKAGARYQVVHLGEAIRDQGGVVIGRQETEVGELEVTDVRPSLSIARMVQKGGAVARGDIIKPAKH